MNLLRVRDLTVTYPDNKDPTLRGITFDVQRSETLLVLGHSGSGKSTLALALCGLIPGAIEAERSGSVFVGDTELSACPPSEACRRIGILFQDPEAQFCMLTVEDEIAFGLENVKVPRAEMGDRIKESLRAVGLKNERKTRIDRLSGGMKQALALACLLAVGPPVLILDEPTANLDPQATEDFFALLPRLIHEKGHTVIVIEHKLEVPASLADRTLVLAAGAVKRLGPTRYVFSQESEALRQHGVWQPFGSEIASVLQRKGRVPIQPHPLSIEELVAACANDPVRREALVQVVAERRAIPDVQPEANSSALDALRFDQVTFTYPDVNRSAPAVNDVTWAVPRGGFVALVGPNGSGKTTLAHLALALLRPRTGSVQIFGQDVSSIRRRRFVQEAGLVFQNPEHQFITDTVYDEVAYGLRLIGHGESEVKARVWTLLDDFFLSEQAGANPFTLSQGEKRRLSVAGMLASDQRLLVLDEPTFGQDYKSAYNLMNYLAALPNQGRTVVMITHDMRLVWEYAKQVAVMRSGTLVFWGPVRELFERDEVLHEAHLRLPPALQILNALNSPGDKGGV